MNTSEPVSRVVSVTGSSLVVSSVCRSDDAPRTPDSGLNTRGHHDHPHPIIRDPRARRPAGHRGRADRARRLLGCYSSLTRDAYHSSCRSTAPGASKTVCTCSRRRRRKIECFGRGMEAQGRARSTSAGHADRWVAPASRNSIDNEPVQHLPGLPWCLLLKAARTSPRSGAERSCVLGAPVVEVADRSLDPGQEAQVAPGSSSK
jgi:hypothetical protein